MEQSNSISTIADTDSVDNSKNNDGKTSNDENTDDYEDPHRTALFWVKVRCHWMLFLKPTTVQLTGWNVVSICEAYEVGVQGEREVCGAYKAYM